MTYANDTSPSGNAKQGAQGDAIVADAKAGSPKSTTNTYADRLEAPHKGPASIAANSINKPGTPRPSGSTADTTREKP